MTIMNMSGSGKGKKDDTFYEIHQSIPGVSTGYLNINSASANSSTKTIGSSDVLGWNNYAVVYDGYLYIFDENGRTNTNIAMTSFVQGSSDGTSIYICTTASATSKTWIEVVKNGSKYTKTTVDWVPAKTALIFDKNHVVADDNGYCAFMEKNNDEWTIVHTTNCKTPTTAGFSLWSPKRWFSTNNIIYTETQEINIGNTILYSASYGGEVVFSEQTGVWLETNKMVEYSTTDYPYVMYDGENVYYSNYAFNKNEITKKGIHRCPLNVGSQTSAYTKKISLLVFASPPKGWNNYINAAQSSYSDGIYEYTNGYSGVLYNATTETILY